MTEIREGDTTILNLEVTKEDGSAKDISGADIQFTLSMYAGSEPVISKDTSNTDVSVIDGANGEAEIRIDSTETHDLGDSSGENYHYEIKVRDDTGDVDTVTTGTFTIYASSETF